MLTLHDDDLWHAPPQRSVCSGAWYAPWRPAELPRRLSSADANFALPPRLQHTSPLPFIAPHLSQNVVPALGAVLAIFMAASPTRTVWRTRRRKDIGGEAGRGGCHLGQPHFASDGAEACCEHGLPGVWSSCHLHASL